MPSISHALWRRLDHNFAHIEAPSLPPSPYLPPPLPPLVPPAWPPSMPPLVTWARPDVLQALVLLLLIILAGVVLLCVLPLYCLRDKAFLTRLCSGRVGRLLNVACCCPVLCFNAWDIYLRPCMKSYFMTLVDGLLCAPFRAVCCMCCCRHTDRKFPPKPASIGQWEGKSFADDDIVWVRARELLGDGEVVGDGKSGTRARVKLFEDDVNPKDVGQGAVGDCWLIAAFAAAAEHPGLVTGLFLTKRANPRGKYAVRLFDWQAGRWVVLTLDENLPAGPKSRSTALFAQPKGREIWVAMLEKAFAKFVGNFGALDGGSTAWALNALTGDPVFELRKGKGDGADGGGGGGGGSGGGGGTWERIDMRAKHDEKNKRAVELVGRSPPEKHTSLQTFLLLRRYAQQKALMGASFGSYGGGGGEGLNGEDMGPQGLVSGHAYTILDARRFGKTKVDGQPLMLVQLRNPWGRGEWEGAWSDKSELWAKHGSVKSLLRPVEADDGAFWMAWGDFDRIFEQIDICARSTGVRDLQLNLKEADGCVANCLGPAKGCCLGCVAFWCCCRGCAALYGHAGGSEMTLDIGEDEKSAFDDDVASRVGQLLEGAAATVQEL